MAIVSEEQAQTRIWFSAQLKGMKWAEVPEKLVKDGRPPASVRVIK